MSIQGGNPSTPMAKKTRYMMQYVFHVVYWEVWPDQLEQEMNGDFGVFTGGNYPQ